MTAKPTTRDAPSPAQRAVLLAYIEGRDPFEGLTVNARTGRTRTVYSCQRKGWLHSTRQSEVTDAGRKAVALEEPCRKTA